MLLLLGGLAIVPAWRYTGGDNPYGYRGPGELSVFRFFCRFATLGTLWTQAQQLTRAGWLGAVGVGAIAAVATKVTIVVERPADPA